MREVSRKGRIVLFPTVTTSMYFKQINNFQKLLSGSKGTGKSFSFFNFAYLNSFLVDLRTSVPYNAPNPLLEIFSLDCVSYVKNLSYVNLKDVTKDHYYFVQLMRQFSNIYPIAKIKKDFLINQSTSNCSPSEMRLNQNLIANPD